MAEYIKWSFEHRLSGVDFLSGEEGYKDRFANMRGRLASFAGARTVVGWLAMLADEKAGAGKTIAANITASKIPP